MEKYADAPFAIVGVNSDPDMEEIRRICEEKDLSWPSFFNGGGTDGPISTRWGVRGWPTVYVIDHEGIIRETNARGERLDRFSDFRCFNDPRHRRRFLPRLSWAAGDY